jgi:cytoskeletal protein RodZ
MASFGTTLKRAREARGLTLDDIAKETRVARRYLAALEDETLSMLPGGAYNRAYLRTYAKVLGLEAKTLLSEYATEESLQHAAADDDLDAINRALDERREGLGVHGRWTIVHGPSMWTLLLAGFIVFIIAVGWIVAR